jgi:hypothetical protein
MDTNKASSVIFALVLIAAGILLMLGGTIASLHISRMWPLFMMIPVAVMAVAWLKEGKKAAGVAYPITLLTLLTVYFIWLNFAGWARVKDTWPLFILIPGLSFGALFLAIREKGVLIPAAILSGLGIFFLSGAGSFAIAAGIALTFAGFWIIVRSFRRGSGKTGDA